MVGRIILSFAFVLAGIYFSVFMALFLGLFRVGRGSRKQEYTQVFVSVVVPARDEEEYLLACVESLLDQTYPKELYEVILVNDRSTDNTLHIAREFAEKDKRVKVLNTTERHKLTGKQRALDTGIRASNGDIVLNIDADCEAPPEWIEDTVREFDTDVGLVAGYTPFIRENPDQSILQKAAVIFQSIDLLSSYGISMGSMALGLAWTCTGNNLAFRREIYDELGGFESLGFTSTEDSMLLQWVDRNTKWKVIPMLNAVYTRPTRTFAQFYAQRARWISDNLQFRLSAILFAVVGYWINLLVLILAGLCIFGVISYMWLILFSGLKAISEFPLVCKSLKIFHRTDLLKYWPLVQPFHVLYMIAFGVHSLSSRFTWKGREYRSTKT
ncbi:glycosyltransferase [Candidatus Poribacteria bacterium]